MGKIKINLTLTQNVLYLNTVTEITHKISNLQRQIEDQKTTIADLKRLIREFVRECKYLHDSIILFVVDCTTVSLINRAMSDITNLYEDVEEKV